MLDLQSYLDRIDELRKQNAEFRAQKREQDVKDPVQIFKELLKIYLNQGDRPKFGLTELPHKDLCNALFALDSLDDIVAAIDDYANKSADPAKPIIDRNDRFGALLIAYHLRMPEEAGRLEGILIFTNILLPTALQLLISVNNDEITKDMLRNILDFMKVLSPTQRQAIFAQLQSLNPDQNRFMKDFLDSEKFQALISLPTKAEVKEVQPQNAPTSLVKQEETKKKSTDFSAKTIISPEKMLQRLKTEFDMKQSPETRERSMKDFNTSYQFAPLFTAEQAVLYCYSNYMRSKPIGLSSGLN